MRFETYMYWRLLIPVVVFIALFVFIGEKSLDLLFGFAVGYYVCWGFSYIGYMCYMQEVKNG